jgi:hypothetical protein
LGSEEVENTLEDERLGLVGVETQKEGSDALRQSQRVVTRFNDAALDCDGDLG